jgi:hypothetical protein
MITINSLSNVVTADISGDLVTVLSTLLLAENPPLYELGQAISAYEQGLIAAAVPAPEIQAIDPGQIAELQATIGQLQQTIEQQQIQLSQHVITDWPGLQKDLLEASLAGLLTEIAALAKATPNPPNESLEAEALALIGAIGHAIVTTDRITVIQAYQALLGHPTTGAGFVPKLLGLNPDAAPGLMALIQFTLPKLQQVLDDRGIPKNLLKFVD